MVKQKKNNKEKTKLVTKGNKTHLFTKETPGFVSFFLKANNF
jgi:hypothetical protein